MRKKEKYFWIAGREPPPLDPHSEAKHELFRAYLNAYVSRLCLRPEQERLRLTVVDGFCGGGLYRRADGDDVSGSPMIFLNEIAAANEQLFAERRKGFVLDVDFFFVDARLDHLSYLRDQISKSPHAPLLSDKIKFIAKPFSEAAREIISCINSRRGKRRSLFFLDQYGYSEVSLALVRSIFSSLHGAEIVLTFAVDSLINYLNDSDRFINAVRSVELTRENVVALRKLWDTSEADARYVVQNALYEHVTQACGAPRSSPFFVRSNTSKRAFWLIHLSRHHTARDVMGEIHWRIQNSSIHYGKAGLLSLGFDAAFAEPSLPFDFDRDARSRSIKRVTEEAPRLIYARSREGNGFISLDDLFKSVCNFTPVTRAMLNGVLNDLKAASEIDILNLDGVAIRSGQIDWNDRLTPPQAPSLFSMWNPVGRID